MKTSIIKSRSVVTVSMLVIHVTLGCGLPSRERLPAQETARPTSPKLPPADKTSKDAYFQSMLAARETMVRMQIQIDSKTLQEIMELCRKGDLERATAVVKSIHALRYERCKQDVHAYIRSKGYIVVPEPFVDHINRFCDYGRHLPLRPLMNPRCSAVLKVGESKQTAALKDGTARLLSRSPPITDRNSRVISRSATDRCGRAFAGLGLARIQEQRGYERNAGRCFSVGCGEWVSLGVGHRCERQ
jgi:hypothetical protein